MSAIDELIDFMHSLSSSHLPEGWPAVRMQQITMLLDEIESLRQERDKLRARVAELEAALQGMLDIVADSRGVAGYHLNGDTAEWDEFDEVDAAEKLLNQLEADNG